MCFEEGGFLLAEKMSRYMGMQAAMPVVEALCDMVIASSFGFLHTLGTYHQEGTELH